MCTDMQSGLVLAADAVRIRKKFFEKPIDIVGMWSYHVENWKGKEKRRSIPDLPDPDREGESNVPHQTKRLHVYDVDANAGLPGRYNGPVLQQTLLCTGMIQELLF